MGHADINMVMGRCTASASEFLFDLSLHPAYPAILAKVAQIEGPVFRGDIEHALAEVLRPDA
jgi:hypothetical protein